VDNNEVIKRKFKVMFNNMAHPYMYAELHNGKFTKTYIKEGEIVSDYITQEEYSSALAHIILRRKDDTHEENI
jgi:hypothetical protein